MTAARFFTDEDIYGTVAPALRKSGVDAISTPESGRRGETDESQLQWAADQQRVLVTFNVAHFAALHGRWMSQRQHHAGIIISQQRPIGDLLRRLQHLHSRLDQESLRNRLEFLGDW